ncbi:phosphatidylinositol N-acetylglucosaminyltransferase subunit Y isoform X2 [Meriones unguiculatus]|uniref:phosphatidylinositol N-acetylglucosaminyltransferase subunit Y isoform X2 n=1 Tax=Meriones unguiculatus TaxID=10047 RepID=UPI00293F3347|nr:phosphatidylinositol N-acetylglucosaminyltransferase subunit Y isoform X2 [Meriones unguiculatus]
MSTRGGASSPELGVSLRPLQGLGRGRWAPRLRGAVTVTDRRRRDRASAGPRVLRIHSLCCEGRVLSAVAAWDGGSEGAEEPAPPAGGQWSFFCPREHA